MQVSGYSGNAGGNREEGFSWHDEIMFSTYDRDNDPESSRHCAALCGGGFWYKACYRAGVNCERKSNFAWYRNVRWIYLQTSRMWLTC